MLVLLSARTAHGYTPSDLMITYFDLEQPLLDVFKRVLIGDIKYEQEPHRAAIQTRC